MNMDSVYKKGGIFKENLKYEETRTNNQRVAAKILGTHNKERSLNYLQGIGKESGFVTADNR